MTRLIIRDATADDADRLGEIKVAAWRSAYAGMIGDDVLAAMNPGEWSGRFRERLVSGPALPDVFQLVSDGGDGVVGYVMAGPCRDADLPDAGEIYALYVHPAAWRGGVGTRLMSAVADRLAAAGYGRASLWVLAANRPARAFYESLAWHVDGDPAVRGHGAPEVRYVTTLER